MINRILLIVVVFCSITLAQPVTAPSDQDEAPSLIANGDFEHGINDWISKDAGMSQVKPEAARTGSLGLRVTDEDEVKGSSLGSRLVPASSNRIYLLRGYARIMSGKEAALHIQFFDADNKQLTKREFNNDINVKVKGGDWTLYTLRGTAPENAAFVRVWIHTYNAQQTILDVDDISLHEVK
jgi:hypothetical protein